MLVGNLFGGERFLAEDSGCDRDVVSGPSFDDEASSATDAPFLSPHDPNGNRHLAKSDCLLSIRGTLVGTATVLTKKDVAGVVLDEFSKTQ